MICFLTPELSGSSYEGRQWKLPLSKGSPSKNYYFLLFQYIHFSQIVNLFFAFFGGFHFFFTSAGLFGCFSGADMLE